ncbi:hypothetical protein Ancab_017700 [Ancistrocladus abbreviatus]
MIHGNGPLSVPPGFRFHPTEEELIWYYLKKKVSYETTDLEVIREVDLNKLEPWDLKDKCRIGSGPQNEWYFFSHKDKRYPTGTRTNRATAAGFWKATGRDKAIYLSNSNRRIGMRKTLVFYTGRAPHGQKTDWIMHEYRLDDDNPEIQEDGWVVCKVFKKKNHMRGGYPQPEPEFEQEENYLSHSHYMKTAGSSTTTHQFVAAAKQPYLQPPLMYGYNNSATTSSTNLDGSMHLPQLSSPESTMTLLPFLSVLPTSLSTMDLECSQNLLRLTSAAAGSSGGLTHPSSSVNGDWSILDKLLNGYQSMEK